MATINDVFHVYYIDDLVPHVAAVAQLHHQLTPCEIAHSLRDAAVWFDNVASGKIKPVPPSRRMADRNRV